MDKIAVNQSAGRRSADHASMALDLMEKHDIEPNPNNYRIWFTYAAGANKQLNQIINVLLSNKRAPNQAMCEDLYYQFFQNLDEAAQLAGVTVQIETQLTDLVSSLSKAGLDTSKFGQALEGATQALKVSPQAENGLHSVINLLMNATQQIEKRNQNLQIHLQHSRKQVTELHTTIETIRTVSLTDQLTEIGNRRSFDDHLRENAMQSMETGEPLCLLLLDLDKFKNFNDIWGHSLGDQVLRLFASCMQKTVGDKGFCARYGGEEFAVILPNMDIPEAVKVANAIRDAISSREIVNRSSGQKVGAITVSVGAAQFAHGEPLAALIERADAGLYAAKQNGRNRVVCENELLRLQQGYKTALLDIPALRKTSSVS